MMAIELDPDTTERVNHLAEARQCTPHGVIQEAIRLYVEREERREALLQDGIRAWNEYKATGLHLTMEEVDAWLAKLEEGQDVEPPECHV
jgi:predicted transcriptional regulator